MEGNTEMNTNIRPSVLVALCVVLGAANLACDDGGGGSGPDTTAPTVASTNPSDTAVDVPIDTTVEFVFSEALDSTTVSGTSIVLTGPVGTVPAVVSYGGLAAVISPDSDLAYSTSYTGTVSVTVTDPAGNPLAAEFSMSFTTVAAPDTTAPTVDSTSPTTDATDVDTTTVIEAVFDEAMDAATITTTSFTVADQGGDVSGAVSYAGTTATFTPDANLGLATTYTVTLSTAVEDLAGNPIATEYSWDFTTAGGSWSDSGNVDESNTYARMPRAAADAAGNVIVVWMGYDNPALMDIKASRFDIGTSTWSTPLILTTGNTGLAQAPQIAVDSAGNAIAIWTHQETASDEYNIFAKRYDVGTDTWDAGEVNIEDNPVNSTVDAQIAMDSAGNAIVVWTQNDGTSESVFHNRYEPGTGWLAQPVILQTAVVTPDYRHIHDPKIAMDSDGNAAVVWRQDDFDPQTMSAMTNRYDSTGGSWSGEESIVTDWPLNPQSPNVGICSSGSGVAVWRQYAATGTDVLAVDFDLAGGLGTGQTLNQSLVGAADLPQVVVADSGDAVVVFQIIVDGKTYRDIYASEYDSGLAAWSEPAPIESDDSGHAEKAHMVMDANGVSYAVWQQSDGIRTDIWASIHTSSAGWQSPASLEATFYNAIEPCVAVDPDGRATAVWSQSITGGKTAIRTSRFE